MKRSTVLFLCCCSYAGFASAEIKTITLDIPRMDCPVCPITVEAALNKVVGVTEVKAVLDTRSATVSFDDEQTSIQALTDATANAGYPSGVKE